MDFQDLGTSNEVLDKWAPVLEGIEDPYTRRVTAQLMENEAKHVISEGEMNEAPFTGDGATTVGKLGTFQKFAFPLVRRVFPELIANNCVSVQAMSGPTSQIFYLGSGRAQSGVTQNIFKKYQLTYRGLTSSKLAGADSGSSGIDLDTDSIDTSTLLNYSGATASGTYGGQIANFPNNAAFPILGFSVSAGEDLTGTGIPEMTFTIEQQPVFARTRKMRALWTLEASQDLKAYHNLDLEGELTSLLGQELKLEIDRELIEDLRMIAYDVSGNFGGFQFGALDQSNSQSLNLNPTSDSSFGNFNYDFSPPGSTQGSLTSQNVWLVDFTSSSLPFAPQHVGHVYANLLGVINIAAQDIYKTTHRGPGSWLITSPLMASLLFTAAKLEGGISHSDKPTNIGKNRIEYRGKFMGMYDLYVDPLYPEDEILMGYKGDSPFDAGYVYAPYIPLQALPKIIDPETFHPRKGILTRYGKAAIAPASRFYRIIRVVGPSATNYMITPFANNAGNNHPSL